MIAFLEAQSQRNGNGAAIRPPHDLDLHREAAGPNSIPARIRRIQSAGPQVKIELSGAKGEPIVVLLAHDRFRENPFSAGEEVFVKPREVKVFLDDGAGI